MKFFVVLDISSIIWNRADYEANTHNYYELAEHISQLIEVLQRERPEILLRNELLYEIVNGFPFDVLPKHFESFGTLVYLFLSSIGSNLITYPAYKIPNIVSIPNMSKTHYSDNTKIEITYLVSKIHIDDEIKNVFFTFSYLCGKIDKLRTKEGENSKEYDTIVADRGDNLEKFFANLKPKFEHNPKHNKSPHKTREAWEAAENKREFISQLTCYNGIDNKRPQQLLDKAIKVEDCFISYDDDKEVWVVFRCHEQNKYHGYDEYDENNPTKIPIAVRTHFNK